MIRHVRRLIPIMTVLATLPGTLNAQSEEVAPFNLDSDRPGLGDGAHVMAPGVWQAELGGQYLSGGNARLNAGSSDFGIEDLGIGAKVPMGASGAWNWTVLGLVTIPTGSDDYSAREVTAGATVIGQTTLTESISFALNAGYFSPLNGVGDGSFAVIVTPGFAIPGLPEWSAYAGVASYFGHGDDANLIEAGLAYVRDADTQLDLNWGIDTDSREWFLGVGWARRWR
jgi:hypothetical protein